MLALDTVYLVPGFLIVLEGILSVILLALIGAAGYMLFFASMKNDRAAKQETLYRRNPWETINRQDTAENPPKSRWNRETVIGLALLGASVVVLALLILLVSRM